MTEQTIKCDRCKKTICKEIFNVTFFKPKVFICRFREQLAYSEFNHDLCKECWESLIDWFCAEGRDKKDA